METIIERISSQDYIGAPSLDLRKSIFLTNTTKDLNETNIGYNVNAKDQSALDRQNSTKYIFYGKLNHLIYDNLTSSIITSNNLELINPISKELNWNINLAYPIKKLDFKYKFFDFEFNISDGIPYSAVTINNNVFIYCGCKHFFNDGDYALINENLYQPISYGDQTNDFENDKYIIVLKNVQIPSVGTLKKVKNPSDIQNSKSQYCVYGLKKFNTNINISYASYSENLFKNPNYILLNQNILNLEGLTDPFGLPLSTIYLTYNKIKTVLTELHYDWVSGQDYNGDGLFECGFHTIENYNFSIYDEVKITTLSGANYTTMDYLGVSALGSDASDINDPLINNMFSFSGVGFLYTPLQQNANGQTIQSSGLVNVKTNFKTQVGFEWDLERINKQQSLFGKNNITLDIEDLGPFVEFNSYELMVNKLSDVYSKLILEKDDINNPNGYIIKNCMEIPIRMFSQTIENGDKEKEIIPDYSIYSEFDDTWKWRDVLDYGFFEDNRGLDFPFNNGIHYVYFDKILFIFNEKREIDIINKTQKLKIFTSDTKC